MTAVLEMSASAHSQRASENAALDRAVDQLADKAQELARLPIGEKIQLLRQAMDGVLAVSADWVKDGHRAKKIPEDAGEEWFAGPIPTLRNLRLLIATLEKLQAGQSAVQDKQIITRSDGRLEVRVMPTDPMDGALFGGIDVRQLMLPGETAASVKEKAGSFHKKKDPEGGVSLILGAGNVSSIPPMDALYKNFAEGFVTLIKMNPVNEWVGPHLERAFKNFIDKGYWRIVYGGAEVGSYLVNHKHIADIHITGSNHTHDLIVWGPPGPERERRMRENDPLLKKTITSELGNVSPVAIVPYTYAPDELDFMARNVVSMIANNGSFNCNAAKMLVLSQHWAQRDAFFGKITEYLGTLPPRHAYYPGAQRRYDELTRGRDGLIKVGSGAAGTLPWTLIPSVDPKNAKDPLFSNEPFCALISETRLDAKEPAEFLRAVTSFMNDTLWGTLNAMIVLPPALEKSAEVAAELDKAILSLRYGTVAINHWPAVVYGTVAPAWGGHPSATLANIQSGLGWVHNTYLLEGIEKSVLRAPLKLFPKPVWFADHKTGADVGRRLIRLQHSPSWLKVPGVAFNALFG